MKKKIIRMMTVILMLAMFFGTMICSTAAVKENVLLGDADRDGIIGINDTTTIQSYLSVLINSDKINFDASDVDFDGNISIADATWIQEYLAKLIEDFETKKEYSFTSETDNNKESTNETQNILVPKEKLYTKNGVKYKTLTYDNGKSETYQWIVTQEASIVNKAIFKTTPHAICNICGADISGDENGKVGDYDPEHADMGRVKYHYMFENCSTSWHVEYDQEFLGYETKEIPEEGYWKLIG